MCVCVSVCVCVTFSVCDIQRHYIHTHTSLQRPRRLKEYGNHVVNDPYYPQSCDVVKLYDKGTVCVSVCVCVYVCVGVWVCRCVCTWVSGCGCGWVYNKGLGCIRAWGVKIPFPSTNPSPHPLCFLFASSFRTG